MDTPVITTQTTTVRPPAKELLRLLNRALNTVEPEKAPKWALDICDEVQDHHEIEIKITRHKL